MTNLETSLCMYHDEVEASKHVQKTIDSKQDKFTANGAKPATHAMLHVASTDYYYYTQMELLHLRLSLHKSMKPFDTLQTTSWIFGRDNVIYPNIRFLFAYGSIETLTLKSLNLPFESQVKFSNRIQHHANLALPLHWSEQEENNGSIT